MTVAIMPMWSPVARSMPPAAAATTAEDVAAADDDGDADAEVARRP